MSTTLVKRTTLLGLTKAQMEAYLESIVTTFKQGEERQQALSFLHDLIQQDKVTLRDYSTLLQQAALKMRSLHSKVHHGVAIDSFFTYTPPTAAQFLNLMQTDNSIIHVGGQTFADDGKALDIKASNIVIDGESNGGSALLNSLVCGCTIEGLLELEGDNIIIKGVKFKRTKEEAGRSLITFKGASSNLTFEDCIFESPVTQTGAGDTRWLDGTGQHFSGSLTVKNCRVTGFTDWMLADATTSSSATPSTAMTDVLIDKCYFQNAGCMAFRQLVSSEKLGTFTFTNNTLVPLSGALHNLFWSGVEANNFGKVVVKNNTATGVRKVNDDRGFLQTWSRSAVWDLEISDNVLSDYNVGYQLAFNSVAGSFYGVSADSYVTLLASQFTNVDNTVSVGYPWDWATTSTMLGVVAGAILPATVPSGLSLIDTASAWNVFSG